MRRSAMSIAVGLVVAFTLSYVVVGSARADDKQDIEALVPKFEEAVKVGRAADVASFYTKDGLMLPPALPLIEGRGAIQTYWQDLFDAGATSFTLTSTEVDSSGDFGYQVGTFSFERGTETEAVRVSGKYLNVWRKSKEGAWRLHRSIWNEDAAPRNGNNLAPSAPTVAADPSSSEPPIDTDQADPSSVETSP